MLDQRQQQAFAELGYLVASGVASPGVIQAARQEIQRHIQKAPPPVGHQGPYFYFLDAPFPGPLAALLVNTPALEICNALVAPAKIEPPEQLQISLNIPPWNHRPGGPHIDGISPPEPTGRPGTFTLLAGFFLTDQDAVDQGNLWVWPGSHRSTAAYLREQGAERLLDSGSYPPVSLTEPRPVTGRAGDLMLAHYLLGHNMGGNLSNHTREVVYFRLRREGHRGHWQAAVQDPFLEFETLRPPGTQGSV